MTTTSAVAAATAAPLARMPKAADRAQALFHAAQLLLPDLERGRRIDAARLRAAMEQAFGGSDTQGVWNWKSAYDACEAAAVLFLRKFGSAMAARAGSCDALLPMLAKVADLVPTHTRRSEESETFQQFSTPIALGLVAGTAAATDRVLDPHHQLGPQGRIAHAQRPGQIRRALSIRERQAALLQSPDHGDEDGDAHQEHRARCGCRPRCRGAARLDR
jgi:hypothetical protein